MRIKITKFSWDCVIAHPLLLKIQELYLEQTVLFWLHASLLELFPVCNDSLGFV